LQTFVTSTTKKLLLSLLWINKLINEGEEALVYNGCECIEETKWRLRRAQLERCSVVE